MYVLPVTSTPYWLTDLKHPQMIISGLQLPYWEPFLPSAVFVDGSVVACCRGDSRVGRPSERGSGGGGVCGARWKP